MVLTRLQMKTFTQANRSACHPIIPSVEIDRIVVKCPLCDDLIRFVNCNHTHPDCPLKGFPIPLTHDIIATHSQDKPFDSESDEAEVEKTAKPAKKRKLTDTQKIRKRDNQENFHFKTLAHQCSKIRNLRSKPAARKSVPIWLLTELNTLLSEPISTLSDRSDKLSPTERLVDIIELMINQVEKVEVQMYCHRLIDQYHSWQLRQLKSSLRRRLIEVLLSVLKRHCQSSRIVENFCDLLVRTVTVDPELIDLYLGKIDCLLEIIGDEINLTTMARMSTLKLLKTIATNSDGKRRILFAKNFVEKICQLIRVQLDKSDYSEIMVVSWECLLYICYDIVAIMKMFLDAGGNCLFQDCYKQFKNQPKLVSEMLLLMVNLSRTESIRQGLMTSGNFVILGLIWNKTKDGWIKSNCVTILTNLLAISDC